MSGDSRRGTRFRRRAAPPPFGIALACYRQSAACYRPDKGKTAPCYAPVIAAETAAQRFRVSHYNQAFYRREARPQVERLPCFLPAKQGNRLFGRRARAALMVQGRGPDRRRLLATVGSGAAIARPPILRTRRPHGTSTAAPSSLPARRPSSASLAFLSRVRCRRRLRPRHAAPEPKTPPCRRG